MLMEIKTAIIPAWLRGRWLLNELVTDNPIAGLEPQIDRKTSPPRTKVVVAMVGNIGRSPTRIPYRRTIMPVVMPVMPVVMPVVNVRHVAMAIDCMGYVSRYR